jgi:hypothetical protein
VGLPSLSKVISPRSSFRSYRLTLRPALAKKASKDDGKKRKRSEDDDEKKKKKKSKGE